MPPVFFGQNPPRRHGGTEATEKLAIGKSGHQGSETLWKLFRWPDEPMIR